MEPQHFTPSSRYATLIESLMPNTAFEEETPPPRRFIVGQPRVHDGIYVHRPRPSPSQMRAREEFEDQQELIKERLIVILRGVGALLAVVAVALQLSLI